MCNVFSMARVKTYRDLEVWQTGMTLVERCYAATKLFPTDERYGLTAQLRRAAVSIPANVAEGACRRTTPAYLNHVSIALGSHGELETCIEIGFRLGYLSQAARDGLFAVADSTGRLLNGLLRSLESRIPAR
jgi:four helix bundle protein